MPQNRPPRNLGRYFISRAAVLYRRGLSTSEVVDYLFTHYGKKKGIESPQMLHQFLLAGRGFSPNVAKKFEGKKKAEILAAFSEWSKREKSWRERSAAQTKTRSRELADARNKKRPPKRTSMPFPNETPDQRKERRGMEASQRMRERYQNDPAFRQRNTEQLRQISRRPSFKTEMSERMKRKWAEEDYRANQTRAVEKGTRTEQFRQRRSEIMKERWRNPEYRAQQIAMARAAMQKYWNLIKNSLLAEFASRKHVRSFNFKTEFWEISTLESPVSKAIEKEQQERVAAALKSLPPAEREVIISTFFEGESPESAARVMGITIKQLNNLLNAGYQKLAKKLQDK